MKAIHKIVGLLALTLTVTAGSAWAQSPQILPTLANSKTYPVDINNSGTIVGVAYDSNYTNVIAVKWESNSVKPLGGFASSFVTAINDSGVIIGGGQTTRDSQLEPVAWIDGVPTKLPTLGAGGVAYDINSAGDIVGYVNSTYQTVPALWRKGKLTVLPTLYENGGEARAIDESGIVSGTSQATDYSGQTPCTWVNESVGALPITFGEEYIGVLGVTRSGASRTAGFIVQRETYPDGTTAINNLAVAWQDGVFRVLQRPSGIGNSFAYSVNANGVYVGVTTDEIGYATPTFWDQDGAVRLPLEPGRSAFAAAANESGLVIGVDHTDGRNPIPLLWRVDSLDRLSMTSVQTVAGASIAMQTTVKRAGKPVAKKTVEFQVNNKKVGTAVTDNNGVAKMTYKVPTTSRGRQRVMASIGGSNYLFRNVVVGKGSSRAAVTPAAGKINQTVKLAASLRAEDMETPLANRELSLFVNSKSIAKAKTSAKGVAQFTYKIPAGMAGTKMPIEIRFAGDNENLSTVGRASLAVKN